MMRRPVVLQPGPSIIVAMLGGIVGTVLWIALMYAAPVWGASQADILRTFGGVFTTRSDVALALGAIIAVVFGVVVWPSVIFLVWAHLPGGRVSMGGALVKGGAAGLGLWVVAGVVLWIATELNRTSGAALAGPFGADAGAGAAVALFLGSILYGLAVTIIAGMENAISTFDALGWKDFYHAAAASRDYGAHRSTPDSIPERLRHE